MTQSQKTLAFVSFVIVVAGATAYWYFKKASTPIQGINDEDIAELKQIEIV